MNKKTKTVDGFTSRLADRRQFLTVAAAAAASGSSLLVPRPASAATYPTKPIRVIVPFGAGGAVDIVARVLGMGLTEQWGQPVVVESRAGAGSVLGQDVVAKSPADGYTLLVNTTAQVIAASLYRKLPFDPSRAFTPIAMIVSPSPLVVIVNPAVPAKTLKEFIAYAKEHPNGIAYGSGGIGGAVHLGCEMLAKAADIKLMHIPYKGAAQALTDVIGGQVQMTLVTWQQAQQLAQQGKVRVLAQTGRTRSSTIPDVPAASEAGLPGFEVTGWFGLYGPAGMPADVVAMLNAAAQRAMNKPEAVSALAKFDSAPPQPMTAAEFARFNQEETVRFAAVIKDTGAMLDEAT